MKRAFASVPTRWWTDRRFLQLAASTRAVLLALWTAPETMLCGISTLGVDTLARRVGMSTRAAAREIDKLEDAGYLTVDRDAVQVWLHQYVELQLGGHPASSPAWLTNTVNALAGLTQTAMVQRYRDAYSLPIEAPSRPKPREAG
jgi:hypothetical protein